MSSGRRACGALALALVCIASAAQTSRAAAGLSRTLVDAPAARRRSQLEMNTGGSYTPCQAAAPAECGFYYSTMETILFAAGVIEFSWFDGICSARCLQFITGSEECQESPEIQQLALSVCQAYSCSFAVESACGDTSEGELVNHTLACSAECGASMESAGCDGAEEILPAFGIYKANLGAAGAECQNFACQQTLVGHCTGYNEPTKSMPRTSLCGTKCYDALKTDECLGADINLVAEEGTFLSKWSEHADDSTYWGPDAAICSEWSAEFVAEFADLQMAALMEPGAMEEFTDEYIGKIKSILEDMGIDPSAFLINILNVTAGSMNVGTEIIFHDEESFNLFMSHYAAFASFFSIQFQDIGQTDISSPIVKDPPPQPPVEDPYPPPAVEDPSLPPPPPPLVVDPEDPESPDSINATVKSADPLTILEEPAGPNWVVIGVVAGVGALTVLSMIGLAVWMAKKKKKEDPQDEEVMFSNPVAGTEQQAPPPDL